MNRSLCRRLVAGAALGCAAVTAAVVLPSAAQAAPAVKQASVVKQASDTYFAAGQYLKGPALYKPACKTKFSCSVSGDATAFLYKMHWTQWTASKAIGSGSYLLNSCTPNCALGKFYDVPIVVTFTNPVKACFGKSDRWYWTKATFRFTHGLPPALRGGNGPVNPWVFTGLAQEAKASCR
jgi:hypothetical protein